VGKKSQHAATRNEQLRERVMAFLDHGTLSRFRPNRQIDAHLRRVQVMLVAACLATLGLVAVAGTMLTRLL
jgi:hypothetical protein